jgi:tRNA (cmo5U34)-methyltransferase
MPRDQLFQRQAVPRGGFRFDSSVVAVFDDMLERSIPLYQEQRSMVAQMAARLWRPETIVYELGCSTATMLIALAEALPDARLVGYDSSTPMIERAREKIEQRGLADRIEVRQADLGGDLADLRLERACVVSLCWTLHFIPPQRRADLIRHIAAALPDEGALIVAEKVRADEPSLDADFADFYHDHKRRNDYSDEEIERKREALHGVLVPLRAQENLDLFQRNGFPIVETFFRWFSFAGFLCLKGPRGAT